MSHCLHENVVKLLGVCPLAGQIILEYCEKMLGELLLHTLADLLHHLGDNFHQEFQLNALADIAEGLNYIYAQSIVHGDLKPHNILVNGEGDDEFVFKLADYSRSNVEHMYALSKSSTSLQQLMTPSYAAPELFNHISSRFQSTKESDIHLEFWHTRSYFKQKHSQSLIFSLSLLLKLGIVHQWSTLTIPSC